MGRAQSQIEIPCSLTTLIPVADTKSFLARDFMIKELFIITDLGFYSHLKYFTLKLEVMLNWWVWNQRM